MTLRVASDGAGLGAFHVAAETLGDIQHVFAADDATPCQRWLENILAIPKVGRLLSERRFKKSAVMEGSRVLMSLESVGSPDVLDIYGCSFPAPIVVQGQAPPKKRA